MKQRRTLALILAGLLSLPALVSCADDSGTADTTVADTTVAADTVTPETTLDPNARANHFDKLPEDLNFDGEQIMILFRGTIADLEGTQSSFWIRNDVCGTDNIGEIVSDAVWERNTRVQERLGITLEWMPSGGSSLSEDQSIIRQTVMSASDEIDAFLPTGNSSSGCGLGPYMRDLANAPYIDYEQPWWWDYAIEALSMDGKKYQFIVGDMLLTNLSQTAVLYFNKEIYDANFGDPDQLYQLTLDGKLTHDEVIRMSEAAYNDINGDGIVNTGDTFGIVWSTGKTEELSHIFVACDLDMYTRDEDGGLVITMNNERTQTAVESIYRMINENKGSFSTTTDLPRLTPTFAEGQALFMHNRLSAATGTEMREMEQEYGILPIPKLDAEQANYVSYSHDSGTVLCVPKTCSDKNMEVVGATLEALCGEAHRTYIDAFLETALKMRYSRDALSGQCIDIVMNTVTKNTLMEYATYTASIVSNCLYTPAKSRPSAFASAYTKCAAAAEKTWQKALDAMQEADQ